MWIKVDPDTLNPEVFGWFGQSAGKPIGDLGLKVAKHTKANAQGKKLERPKLRELRWSNFDEIKGVDELFSKLFDPCDQEDK